ncbi:S-layer family protein [Ureibacillus xyleni]|uniref:S-layer family protein n=1 Tax=Ureibacillus xyleni TaxID=614648 RepID=A0A285R9S2_9BACL|nr:S-layer homology domain-containing protein [Ureibacillus xyleni]SOB90840.1 S-layer family protein [Ureibacillus xyleni]
MFRKISSKQKNKKYKLFTATTIALATTAVAVAQLPASAEQENPFTDVKPGTSHYDGIVSLYNEGIVTGVTSTSFKPNQKATRGETAYFIAKALNLDTTNVTNPGFKDVPTTHKYYGAIAALYEQGIIGGYGDEFKPNNLLTRSQIAKMLTLSFDLELAASSRTKFTDVNKIKDTNTKVYIQTLVDYSITIGTSPTTFSPNGNLTRGQLATFLYRAINETENSFDIIGIE